MTTLRFEPAAQARFDDVVTMLGPKKHPNADACWCLTYRLGFKESARLGVDGKREAVRELCGRALAPGVLAYRDEEVVGWAAIAPRSELTEFQDETSYPRVDDADVWCLFCLRAKAGNRGRGIGQHLIEGAVGYARAQGAGVVEAYPLDTEDKVSGIFAYPGVRRMFERAGFTQVATTGSSSGGHQRIVMRLPLS